MIVLTPEHDRFHNIDAPGAYEWTYFDGLSYDGQQGFTVIWFRGIPMSPYYAAQIDRDLEDALPVRYSGVAVSLYDKSGEVFAILHESSSGLRFSTDADGNEVVAFDRNRLTSSVEADGTRRFDINLDARRTLRRTAVEGNIVCRFPETEHVHNAADTFHPSKGEHYWIPSGPAGRFEADLERTGAFGRTESLKFSGNAYHDRNFGFDPLHKLNADWHWGRVQTGEQSLVFYSIRPRAGAHGHRHAHEFGRLLHFESGRLIADDSDLDVEATYRTHWTTLHYPSLLNLESSHARGTVRTEGLLDSGPFYHRARSRFRLNVAGESVEAPGITEYLRPDRLARSIFRPFVKFRVRRR